jgi:hypothetical protein
MIENLKLRPLHFFIPFEELDRADGKKQLNKEWVPGYAFVNEVVRGEGGVRLKRSAMESASKTWFSKWGNVREMHDKRAAGVVRHSEWDDVGWFVASEIVDPVARLKCERGVYKGYSVGVRPMAVDPQNALDVTECEIVELSLVDRPKDPDALFSLYRAEDYEPNLAQAVEVRRLPGHSPLDSPETISAGSTYYGEEPIKEGDLAIVKENDHFCLYGPDGQKLGEFPTLAEARARARKVNEVTKPDGNIEGAPESPIGGKVQDQSAGPMMHSPIPGPEEKRAVTLAEGEELEVRHEDGLLRVYRPGGEECLFQATSHAEIAELIRKATVSDPRNTPPPLQYGLREGNTGWFIEVKSGQGRERLIGAFSGRAEAEASMLVLARISKAADIPLEDFDRAVDEVLSRAISAATAGLPIRENLEGKGGKVERESDMDGAGDEADDAADDEEKRKKKRQKAIEDAVKEKEKAREDREDDAKDAKDDAKDAKERVIEIGPHREPLQVSRHNSSVMRVAAPAGSEELWQIKTCDNDLKVENHYWGRYRSEAEATAALYKSADDGLLIPRERAVTVTHATADQTMAGLQAPPKEKAFTDAQATRAYPEESVAYADDANMKWPLDTEINIRAAWDHVTTPLSGKQYSSTELAAMKSKIKAAAMAKGFALGDSAADPANSRRGELLAREDRPTEPDSSQAAAAEGDAEIQRIVIQKDGLWFVMSHDGTKKLGGPYNSQEDAQARLREIEYFKGGKRDGEKDRGDGSPDEHHMAQSARLERQETVDTFWWRFNRLEEQNSELIARVEVAETEITRAAEAEGELKRLLATREAEIERLSAMPAHVPEGKRPALFTTLPREFYINRHNENEQRLSDIDKLIEEIVQMEPTSDPAEQNRRLVTIQNLKVARQGVPGE